MAPDFYGELLYLMRYTLSAWLFTIAGVILVVSRPQWSGSWLVLVGAVFSSTLVGIRLIGFLERDPTGWGAVAYEAAETFSFFLAGVGVLLVSIRSRKG
jgi:hypothetical protein